MGAGLEAIKRLKPRHMIFIDQYCLGVGQRDAAIAAGFAPKTADKMARQLLLNPLVMDEVDKRQRAITEAATKHAASVVIKAGFTGDQVVREAARIALLDPRRLFDENDALLPPSKWPDDIAAAVASMEVEEIRAEGVSMGVVKKIKFWPKMDGIKTLLAHLGIDRPAGNQESFGRTIHIHMGDDARTVNQTRVGAITIEAGD